MVSPVSRRFSLLGLATAATLLLGQVASTVHLVAVEHQSCPEHGELIHARGQVPRSAPDQARTAVAPDQAPEGGAHAHDPCLATAQESAAPAGAGPPAGALRGDARRAPDVPPVRAARPPLPLLLVAPKTSPPASPPLAA
jgi:hypothetical protein